MGRKFIEVQTITGSGNHRILITLTFYKIYKRTVLFNFGITVISKIIVKNENLLLKFLQLKSKFKNLSDKQFVTLFPS